MRSGRYSRRELINSGVLVGAWVAAAPSFAGRTLLSRAPIVKTALGRVRGMTADRVCIFKGIPYAGSSTGEQRFLPPTPALPWRGVRNALTFGPGAMQGSGSGAAQQMREFREWQRTQEGRLERGLFLPPPWRMSEDCQVLNVWAPAEMRTGSRPVLFWLHGGGFSGGSGDWGWTDGARLARKYDLVVVSINHRLNAFGYLHLGDIGGAEFVDSGNVGMLDALAALQWVRGNIAAFGGDPGNVTMMGQSGGAAKVDVLMAMPAARGLFHKAINLSCPDTGVLTPEVAMANTRRLLAELNITRDAVRRLQSVPAEALLHASSKVEKWAWHDGTHLTNVFAPVVNDRSLPRQPFEPDAPPNSAHVPMMIGNCADETGNGVSAFAGKHAPADDADAAAELQKMGFGASAADRLIRSYRGSRVTASAADILAAIRSDVEFRMVGIEIAERKSRQPAPVFAYLFSRSTTATDAADGAVHSMDMPYFFDNLDRAPGLAGSPPDPRARALACNMSGAVAAFMRTGDPNHPGLPLWQPYSERRRATMIFDDVCRLADDPGGSDRQALQDATSHQPHNGFIQVKEPDGEVKIEPLLGK